jgi:hypothetical protein
VLKPIKYIATFSLVIFLFPLVFHFVHFLHHHHHIHTCQHSDGFAIHHSHGEEICLVDTFEFDQFNSDDLQCFSVSHFQPGEFNSQKTQKFQASFKGFDIALRGPPELV